MPRLDNRPTMIVMRTIAPMTASEAVTSGMKVISKTKNVNTHAAIIASKTPVKAPITPNNEYSMIITDADRIRALVQQTK